MFLDEIGDMSLKTQAKVLRALEEQAFERVGGRETLKVDVRVIAASNRDLPSLIAQGAFREDLFYRLNVIPIEVPPLRARTEDVPALVEHFIRVFCAENGKRLQDRGAGGPHLVHDLRVAGQRARAAQHGRAAGDHGARRRHRPRRPALRRSGPRSELGGGLGEGKPLKEARDSFERAYILAELRAQDWNMTRTAERLGIERSHLYRKIRAYGIIPPK